MGGGESVTVGRNTMKQPQFLRKGVVCYSLVIMKVFVGGLQEEEKKPKLISREE